MDIPPQVIDWVREVFRECNASVTRKLCDNPNIAEEWLDYSWIEHLSRYSSPRTVAPDWTVKIESHYIGALRHFHQWEIADIGVLLFLRAGGRIQRSKVALLQSKRLYPSSGRVSEQGMTDYHYGFARLADPEDLAQSIATQIAFRFTDKCRFGALISASPQVSAISEYEKSVGLRVYYQLYNPWAVPFDRRVPIADIFDPDDDLTLGVRVLPAQSLHALLAQEPAGYRPQLADISKAGVGADGIGWRLENFIADEFMGCREGSVFDSVADGRIQTLFFRRTGPIASAIAITVEGPEGIAV